MDTKRQRNIKEANNCNIEQRKKPTAIQLETSTTATTTTINDELNGGNSNHNDNDSLNNDSHNNYNNDSLNNYINDNVHSLSINETTENNEAAKDHDDIELVEESKEQEEAAESLNKFYTNNTQLNQINLHSNTTTTAAAAKTTLIKTKPSSRSTAEQTTTTAHALKGMPLLLVNERVKATSSSSTRTHTTVINKLTLRRTRSAPALYQAGEEEHQQQQQQKHEPVEHNQTSSMQRSLNVCADGVRTPKTNDMEVAVQRFGCCAHYKRRAMFVTPCCEKFYNCRFCHDENEDHHFNRKTLTELICTECNTRQKVQERCENCGVCFGKYTCLICNLFDDSDKQQYHCEACGICRIGGSENFFHCAVCDMCLPIQLKIDGHRCVENVSRSHCPVCLGDIHTSRIPCHIPDCGHLLHKMCFDQLLDSGHYTCPTCQTSLIDMTALWEYLDQQALLIPIPHKYENQRIHIFCNDCHQTSKTKFHFIGLKCLQCGAYNTTQDVKRRMSLVTDEPSSA